MLYPTELWAEVVCGRMKRSAASRNENYLMACGKGAALCLFYDVVSMLRGSGCRDWLMQCSQSVKTDPAMNQVVAGDFYFLISSTIAYPLINPAAKASSLEA